MLLSFTFIAHENDREFWVRCVTIRRNPDGSWRSHFSDLSWQLGRRLAERLCDRYGITDRAGLHCGRIFSISEGGAQ